MAVKAATSPSKKAPLCNLSIELKLRKFFLSKLSILKWKLRSEICKRPWLLQKYPASPFSNKVNNHKIWISTEHYTANKILSIISWSRQAVMNNWKNWVKEQRKTKTLRRFKPLSCHHLLRQSALLTIKCVEFSKIFWKMIRNKKLQLGITVKLKKTSKSLQSIGHNQISIIQTKRLLSYSKTLRNLRSRETFLKLDKIHDN